MSFDIPHLFSSAYLFDIAPGPFAPVYFKLVLIAFGLMVVAGLVVYKMTQKNSFPPVKKFLNKLHNMLFWMGLIGLLYVFLRDQNAPYISMPFWLLVWGLGLLVWLGFILKYYFTDRPKQEEKIRQEQEKKKYLP